MRAAPRLAILGAGPTGLEAALAAAERGWPFTVYEAAPEVAGHVRDWGHARMFTPWSMNVSPRARRALGDAAPGGDALPAGDDLADRVLDPVAALPQVAPRLRLGARVAAVGREGLLKHEEIAAPARTAHPFRLLVEQDGAERVERADVVLDCTGTYGNPNALGDGGIPAPGERALAHRIERRLPDVAAAPREWAGRTILLTGAGHSAQTAARALARLAREAPGTEVVWAVRSGDPTWFAVDGDPLAARRSLTVAARELAAGASGAVDVRLGRVTEALREEGGRLAVTLRNGTPEEVRVDRVLALNGGVGDHTLYRQLQVHECYATAAPMRLSAALLGAGAGGDCLAQPSLGPDVLVSPEPGFFILGAKSYGRNSQFLMRTGWEQVDDVVSLLAGGSG
ncbi:MAG TPA: NAD(P)-binding protein [Solirubrobacteraceae bacterium]|nr:NAD(P)-binding protein [Solirubrobacteraceae bacterium]